MLACRTATGADNTNQPPQVRDAADPALERRTQAAAYAARLSDRQP